ncbi:AI-2E family transporter [Natronoglycomyces albus]|uniref:AI-2E family transporter n=1 Tax=Natronoglycomyces albus TaxID=2811108 RepID=A0A895XI69_9ACTN|nr:AI-2E family transporter [Natronoglycomyces albus]QSB05034.1 AI-2E family transporter [Natronoglycomyces albus]
MRKAAAKARQMWVGVRTNPYTERMESARARRREHANPLAIDSKPDSEDETPATTGGGGDDGNDGNGRDPSFAEAMQPPERRHLADAMAIAAAWAWRIIVLAVAIIAVLYLFSLLAVVVIPVAVSFLLAALFQPIVGWLVRRGWNRSLAAAVVLVGGLTTVFAVFTFVVQQFIAGIPDFADQINAGITRLEEWLRSGPYGLEPDMIEGLLSDAGDEIQSWATDNASDIGGQALTIFGTAAGALVYFFTGFFLVLFCMFFFMRDGDKIWHFLTGLLPVPSRAPLRFAGLASWKSLVQFMRTTVVVALVDAIGIGLGLWILDIPLALPLATLVFLGGFIPIVGATVSGAVAVLVALVGTENGLINALLVLGLVLLVQQLESNVLQPLLMSRAVKLHPLAIVLAITVGGIQAGIVGALIAVPILAIINAGVRAVIAYNKAHSKSDPPPKAGSSDKPDDKPDLDPETMAAKPQGSL